MKYSILKIHNSYQQPGGEDESVRSECALLSGAGHRVTQYSRTNHEITNYNFIRKASLGARTVWAWDSYKEVRSLLKSIRPDIAHFDNTFPLVSPAAYYACKDAGVPVVQTLRNYRLLCPGATFQRAGRVCEDCLGKSPWRGALHGCYRGSPAVTVPVAMMLSVHNWLDTWQKMVDCYVSLTEFARGKFIQAGWPANKIVVKPNFVYSPSTMPSSGQREERGVHDKFGLFVGRLSSEKGLHTLFEAWRRLSTPIPLRLVGDGPLRSELENFVRLHSIRNVTFEGRLTQQQMLEVMAQSSFLVFPSEWYETFGRVAVEAFVCGVPVIASRMGAMEEIVSAGRTGLHFMPADPVDLAAKIHWAWDHPVEMKQMGVNARAEYEARYTPERNYDLLMGIYQRTLASVGNSRSLEPIDLPSKVAVC